MMFNRDEYASMKLSKYSVRGLCNSVSVAHASGALQYLRVLNHTHRQRLDEDIVLKAYNK